MSAGPTRVGNRPTIDPGVVREVEVELHRDDVELTIAAPDVYPEIEAASRSADPTEVMSPLTADLTAWFVDRDPCGPGFVVIARDPASGRIVGHFVFYPWPLRHRTASGDVAEVRAYLHVRLWVSREFRRRGVFLSMTRFGIELLRRLGVALVYTVPNQRSAPGFLKLGELHAGDLRFWVRPVVPAWGWLAGIPPRGLEVEQRASFDQQFDGVPDRSLEETTTTWCPRRAELLNWRYPERPDHGYEIRYVHRAGHPIGYLVSRRMRIKRVRTLAVCDFWTDPSESGALRVALEDAIRAGGRADICIAMGGNASAGVRGALGRAGFVPCPKAVLPQPVAVIGGATGRRDQPAELPSVDRWHLTPCDWDVF